MAISKQEACCSPCWVEESSSTEPVELVTAAEPIIDQMIRKQYPRGGGIVFVPWTVLDPAIDGVVEELKRRYQTPEKGWHVWENSNLLGFYFC